MIKVAGLRLTCAGGADGFWAKNLRSLNVAAFGEGKVTRRVAVAKRARGSFGGRIPVWRGPAIPYNIRYAFPCVPRVGDAVERCLLRRASVFAMPFSECCFPWRSWSRSRPSLATRSRVRRLQGGSPSASVGEQGSALSEGSGEAASAGGGCLGCRGRVFGF